MRALPEEETARDPHAAPLFGRDGEVALLTGFLDTAGTAGTRLALTGEPGIGKTRLIDAAVTTARSRGMHVLRAAGAQAEADIVFAALHLLLLPLHERTGGLDGRRRGVLAASLGLGDGPRPGRDAVADAVTALLEAQSRTAPVLVAVDDLQWVDAASAAVLDAVRHRLGNSPVRFLTARRAEPADAPDRSRLGVLALGPLPEQAAAALLASVVPAAAGAVVRRVVRWARGNPLALRELARALSPAQLAGTEPLPRLAPLTPRLEEVYAAGVRPLPAAARGALLTAALEPSDRLGPLRAVPGTDLLRELRPAVRAGLVTLDVPAQRLTFTHPLVRSAVVRLAAFADRQRAHRRLADAAEEIEGRAWHLAAATDVPDETTVHLLDRAARRRLDRGDARGAVEFLLRAAELTAEPGRRRQRLTRAAYLEATEAGDIRTARALVAGLGPADAASADSLPAASVAALLMIHDMDTGSVGTAYSLLSRALDARGEVLDARDAEVVDALHTLLDLASFSGEPRHWRNLVSLTARLRPGAPDDLTVRLDGGIDPARSTDAALRRLDDAVSRVDDEPDPRRVWRLAVTAFTADRAERCRSRLWRTVAASRADGAGVSDLIPSLTVLSWHAFLSGRWAECERTADDGAAMRDRSGFTAAFWALHLSKAAVAAARGDDDAVRSVTDRVIAWATPRHYRSAVASARYVRSLSAMGQGDYERAFRQCREVTPPGRFPAHSSHNHWLVLDLVESAVRLGRDEEAAAHVAAAKTLNLVRRSSRAALLVLAAEALVHPVEQASVLFDRALRVSGARLWTFEYARVELLHGEHLRRRRTRTAARPYLRRALATFRRLGAVPWRDRALRELRLAAPGRRWSPGSLTDQESRVATLASAGLTNRQIATRLMISPRTVDVHLSRTYAKLGIASRAALRDSLASAGPDYVTSLIPDPATAL